MKVTYALKSINGDDVTYWYYPEGNTDKHNGVIQYNTKTNGIKVITASVDDTEEVILPDDINEMIYVINVQKQCMGRTDFIKYEDEPLHSFVFADHAMTGILNRVRNGKLPKAGTAKWKEE